MGTTADKLNKLITTKTAIKNAIISKGVPVSNTDTFSSYAKKISQIPQTEESAPTDPYLEDRFLIFEDNFDGTELDATKWNIEVRDDGCGNDELEDYVESQVSVSNSNLVLTAQKVTDNQWLSGRINSNDKIEFRFGRIEAKIKMDAYQGYWQAFWLLGADHYENSGKTIEGIAWPHCGEIDIIEHVGALNNVQSCYHCTTDSGYQGGTNKVIRSGAYDMTQYHIYALEWTDGRLEYSVDGKVYGYHDVSDLVYNGSNPFSKAYYIIFNFAIGGSLGGEVGTDTPTTSNMYVDWVRIYSPKNTLYPDTLTLTNYEYDTISMGVGETKQLIFKTAPVNSLFPTIKYTSSNTDVAEYHGGVITSKALGTSILTTETKNGLSKVINLVVQDDTSVSSVVLDKVTASGGVGDSVVLTATIIPDTATNKNVIFAANNSNVTLSQNGLTCEVSLVASGETIVTVTTENGNKTATCQIFISEQSIPTDGLICRLEATSSSINGTTWVDQSGNGNDATFYNVEDASANLINNRVVVGNNLQYIKSEAITGMTDSYSIIVGLDYNSTHPTIMNTDHWNNSANLFFIEGNGTLYTLGQTRFPYYGNVAVTASSDKTVNAYYYGNSENDSLTLTGSGTAKLALGEELSHFMLYIGKKGWEDKYTETKVKAIFIYNRALTEDELNVVFAYIKSIYK